MDQPVDTKAAAPAAEAMKEKKVMRTKTNKKASRAKARKAVIIQKARHTAFSVCSCLLHPNVVFPGLQLPAFASILRAKGVQMGASDQAEGTA